MPLLLVAELVEVGALVVLEEVVVGIDVVVLVVVVGEEVVEEVVVVVVWQFLLASCESVEAPCWRFATSLRFTPEPDRLSTWLLKSLTAVPA